MTKEEIVNEEIKSAIQDAFYATGKFTTSDCELMAEGILIYLNDAGFVIHKNEEYASHQPFQQLISWMEEKEKEFFDSDKFTHTWYVVLIRDFISKAKELASQQGWVSVEEGGKKHSDNVCPNCRNTVCVCFDGMR